jgi:hypothetical protein
MQCRGRARRASREAPGAGSGGSSDPMPIQEPVKIRGIKDDGALPIEAKVAK